MLVQRQRLLPLLPTVGLAYIPRGPVGQLDGQITEMLLGYAVDASRAAGASLLRIEPPADRADLICPVLAQLGFKWSEQNLQIRHSAYVNLDRSLTEIMAGFKSKTRYNTRLAERRGISVRHGSVEDLRSFYELTAETGRREGFNIHEYGYYRTVYEAFAPEWATLILASYQGQVLTALMIVKSGCEAVYLYGASTTRERSRMPSYAAQWAAIQWAREQGCKRYDLWGMANPNNPADDLSGVDRFKSGFNPDPVEHPGTFDLALFEPVGALIRAALPLYKQLLGARRRTEAAVQLKLVDLLAAINARAPAGSAAIEICAIANDSRDVRPGSLFVAIDGTRRRWP